MTGTCFISHAREDHWAIEKYIQPILRAAEVDAWLDQERLIPGEEFAGRISEAIRLADWVIVLVSKHSIASKYVRAEAAQALALLEDRVIPVVLDSTDARDLNLLLGPLQTVSFEEDPIVATAMLMRTFRQGELQSRVDSIAGTWSGTLVQRPPGVWADFELPSTLVLHADPDNRLRGSLEIQAPEYGTLGLMMRAEVRYSKYLFGNYHGAGRTFIQFGSLLLEIDGTGSKMTGLALGYGPYSNAIVTVEVRLTREVASK
jgi:hypothetical protein